MGLGVWGKALTYEKYRYIEYTDNTYTKRVEQPIWMGILGPQLQAVEGDSVRVHFLNRADKPLSIHVHGLQYDEDNEGADMKGSGAAVQPGSMFTYHWEADSDAAPGPNDPSSIVWLYHSHVDAVTEVYDGLIGTVVVTTKGMERAPNDPRPKDIDKSFTTLFLIFNENERKIVETGQNEAYESLKEAEEGNLKHAINGFIFGNLRRFGSRASRQGTLVSYRVRHRSRYAHRTLARSDRPKFREADRCRLTPTGLYGHRRYDSKDTRQLALSLPRSLTISQQA